MAIIKSSRQTLKLATHEITTASIADSFGIHRNTISNGFTLLESAPKPIRKHGAIRIYHRDAIYSWVRRCGGKDKAIAQLRAAINEADTRDRKRREVDDLILPWQVTVFINRVNDFMKQPMIANKKWSNY